MSAPHPTGGLNRVGPERRGAVRDSSERRQTIDHHVEVFLEEIQEAEVREPRRGEFVDVCHYSKTGWAIWRREGERKWCTCTPAIPAKPPA